MSLFSSFDINASGMTAQRYRMDIISQNVANANTTRTSDGTPYRRKSVIFEKKKNVTEPLSPISSLLANTVHPYGRHACSTRQNTARWAWLNIHRAHGDPLGSESSLQRSAVRHREKQLTLQRWPASRQCRRREANADHPDQRGVR